MLEKKMVLVVAGVLIDPLGHTLLARRPEGKSMAGLWEFPGGKVRENERPEDALARELHEELGVDIDARDLTPLTFASHDYPDFHLLMPVFACREWRGEPHPRENQKLAWASVSEWINYPMPPADERVAPILAKLLR